MFTDRWIEFSKASGKNQTFKGKVTKEDGESPLQGPPGASLLVFPRHPSAFTPGTKDMG